MSQVSSCAPLFLVEKEVIVTSVIGHELDEIDTLFARASIVSPKKSQISTCRLCPVVRWWVVIDGLLDSILQTILLWYLRFIDTNSFLVIWIFKTRYLKFAISCKPAKLGKLRVSFPKPWLIHALGGGWDKKTINYCKYCAEMIVLLAPSKKNGHWHKNPFASLAHHLLRNIPFT